MAELGLSNPPIFNPCSTPNSNTIGYTRTFGNTDLISGVLAIPHNLGKTPTFVTVIDEFGEHCYVTKSIDVDLNNSQISLEGFTVTNNWKIRIL